VADANRFGLRVPEASFGPGSLALGVQDRTPHSSRRNVDMFRQTVRKLRRAPAFTLT
jgi:hypothetical protein